MASNATPTSAKTASHIVANPPAPSTKTIPFTTKTLDFRETRKTSLTITQESFSFLVDDTRYFSSFSR